MSGNGRDMSGNEASGNGRAQDIIGTWAVRAPLDGGDIRHVGGGGHHRGSGTGWRRQRGRERRGKASGRGGGERMHGSRWRLLLSLLWRLLRLLRLLCFLCLLRLLRQRRSGQQAERRRRARARCCTASCMRSVANGGRQAEAEGRRRVRRCTDVLRWLAEIRRAGIVERRVEGGPGGHRRGPTPGRRGGDGGEGG